jgi:dUTP pyrophosphatase
MQEQLNRLDPMVPLTVKYCDKSNNHEPLEYAKEGDSGFDLRAYITENTEGSYYDKAEEKWCYLLKSGERKLFDTGKYFELPIYTELQVRCRSGLAHKQGIMVTNGVGTGDEAYRGEIKVNLYNSSNQPVIIKSGDRIAQGVIMPVYNSRLVKLEKVDEIDTNTERGIYGHGSTGVQ